MYQITKITTKKETHTVVGQMCLQKYKDMSIAEGSAVAQW